MGFAMVTQKEFATLLSQPVYGSGGKKIGKATHVYYDDATGRPEWVTVKTAMFGGGESFVPVQEAVPTDGHLEVPYSKSKIKDSPDVNVDADGHLSVKEERRLYDFYGIQTAATRQAYAGRQQAEPQRPEPQAADRQASAQAAPERPRTEAETLGAEHAPIAPDTGTPNAAAASADEAMTRSEETMHVHVERHETGRARVRKYVTTEEQQQTIPLRHEEVRLIREPITEEDRDSAMSGPDLSEGEYVVTLHEEKPVVETRVEPKERIRLAIDERTEQHTVRGTVRKEQIKVEGPGEDDQPR